MLNYFYKSTIETFLVSSVEEIIGAITMNNYFDATLLQNKSWEQQIPILKEALQGFVGELFFEFSIPRMGKRVDVIIIIEGVVFVVEFKVNEKTFLQYHIEQVWDYALDLKNFHQSSHDVVLAPILIATEALSGILEIGLTSHNDKLILPIKCSKQTLRTAINSTLLFFKGSAIVNAHEYALGAYSPTPTIIEAAISLYNNHSVEQITRSDAGVEHLSNTSLAISNIIALSKLEKKKSICFVTGVPGAGKTLVGLKVATAHLDKEEGNTSVYLSGNAPLVAILQEALTRDKVAREKISGHRITKREAKQAVKSFIQIIHHYRDAYLENESAPYDHVAIFDEAQRAWNKEQTVKFMRQKKNQPDFDASEPEFLISCLDRHKDWAVIVCLVGGGQEINTGEAGISEWLDAINSKFRNWHVFISSQLTDSEYDAVDSIHDLVKKNKVTLIDDLHLGVSMRSFRAENVSSFIKCLLDLDEVEAKRFYDNFKDDYPIVITRDLQKAKSWLREKARGSERYGIVVSSQAQRLKPLAINVKSPMDPVKWFLEGKEDIRSSYFLEDVASEFHVQGLELDWTCLVWDGDLRHSKKGWKTYSFKGSKWKNIHKDERKKYLINSYRVLLTRARQGMVIVVPEGNIDDASRNPDYYDSTYKYLTHLGIQMI